MNGLITTQRTYDRELPVDDRSDAEIEDDAAERVRECRNTAKPAYVYDAAKWANVAAQVKAKAETSSERDQKSTGT